MGAVLHLVWENVLPSVDERVKHFRLDVDFICPMVPISRFSVTNDEHFNNSEQRRKFLIREKPVGWLDELLKVTKIHHIRKNVETFEGRNKDKNDCEIDCRMKLINPKNVISIHSQPYLKEEFISGPRKKVYLALKILKELTGAKITSYQLKTDLMKTFPRQPLDLNIGKAILKVFAKETNYKNVKNENIHTVGDLFSDISKSLVKRGFSKIDLSRLDKDIISLV